MDLDVLARADLLKFLKKECEERGATIIYATHIFDGLENWPSHIVYVANGKLQLSMPMDKVRETYKLSLMVSLQKGTLSTVYFSSICFNFVTKIGFDLQRTVESWLRKEREEERKRRKERKAKGLPEFEEQIEGSRVINNGWAAGRLNSTIAGEENFVLSSNRVLRQ